MSARSRKRESSHGRATRRPTWYLHAYNDATHLRDLQTSQRLNWASLAPPAEESTRAAGAPSLTPDQATSAAAVS